MLEINKTELPGVLVIRTPRFADGRGFFVETFSERALSGAGVKTGFVQENQSYSIKAGTIRGLHFQYAAGRLKQNSCGFCAALFSMSWWTCVAAPRPMDGG